MHMIFFHVNIYVYTYKFNHKTYEQSIVWAQLVINIDEYNKILL